MCPLKVDQKAARVEWFRFKLETFYNVANKNVYEVDYRFAP